MVTVVCEDTNNGGGSLPVAGVPPDTVAGETPATGVQLILKPGQCFLAVRIAKKHFF